MQKQEGQAGSKEEFISPIASDSTGMYCHQVKIELPKAEENDPIFREKNELIEQRGYSCTFLLPLEDSLDHCRRSLDGMMEVARILSLNEVEFYFVEDDDSGPFNPRNEVEALNVVRSALQIVESVKQRSNTIDTLITMVLNKLGTMSTSPKSVKPGALCEGDAERNLLTWAENEGVKSKIDAAVFEGSGRGGRAIKDIAVGDTVLEIPQHLIICEDTVLNSSMYTVLKDFKELSGETMALLWSMTERHNSLSRFAPYFASLPDAFNTGLSFGLSSIKILEGTIVFEEIMQAREHLRLQYDSLFPSLSNCYPDMFPKEHYTWDNFLWACELWYSNGLKILFPDGTIKTSLVPVLGLLNHGLYPHITRFSKVDLATGKLILSSLRPCRSGEQCFLNYGSLSNSHLLTFYGFILDKNPFDVVPIDLDFSDDPAVYSLLEKWKVGNSHMIRGCWFSTSCLSPFGLPTRLLAALRIALMEEDEVRQLSVLPRYKKVNNRNEINTFESLLSIVSNMEDSLGEYSENDEEGSTTWDVSLAVSYKDSQRNIVRSVSEACSSALRALTS